MAPITSSTPAGPAPRSTSSQAPSGSSSPSRWGLLRKWLHQRKQRRADNKSQVDSAAIHAQRVGGSSQHHQQTRTGVKPPPGELQPIQPPGPHEPYIPERIPIPPPKPVPQAIPIPSRSTIARHMEAEHKRKAIQARHARQPEQAQAPLPQAIPIPSRSAIARHMEAEQKRKAIQARQPEQAQAPFPPAHLSAPAPAPKVFRPATVPPVDRAARRAAKEANAQPGPSNPQRPKPAKGSRFEDKLNNS